MDMEILQCVTFPLKLKMETLMTELVHVFAKVFFLLNQNKIHLVFIIISKFNCISICIGEKKGITAIYSGCIC
jgi:hypothetical protein